MKQLDQPFFSINDRMEENKTKFREHVDRMVGKRLPNIYTQIYTQ